MVFCTVQCRGLVVAFALSFVMEEDECRMLLERALRISPPERIRSLVDGNALPISLAQFATQPLLYANQSLHAIVHSTKPDPLALLSVMGTRCDLAAVRMSCRRAAVVPRGTPRHQAMSLSARGLDEALTAAATTDAEHWLWQRVADALWTTVSPTADTVPIRNVLASLASVWGLHRPAYLRCACARF